MSLDLSFLSSDPLLYFLAHSTLFVLVVAAIFFTFGLMFGWFTWARYKRHRQELLVEVEAMKDEIAQLKRKLAEQTNRATVQAETTVGTETERLRNEHAEPDPVIDSFLNTAAAIIPKPIILPTPMAEPEKEEPQKPEAPVEPLVILGGAVEPEPAKTPRKAGITSKVKPRKHVLQSLVTGDATSFDLTDKPGGDLSFPPPASDLSTPKEPEPPAKSPSPPAPPPPMDEPASQEEPTSATNATAHPEPAELHPPNGESRLISDPHLGLIFASRPGISDDLSHLKGVAHVIERKLNDYGVYTFKQIALWNEENIREFSHHLAFKDRIHREQWVEQARELHFQKYGERL